MPGTIQPIHNGILETDFELNGHALTQAGVAIPLGATSWGNISGTLSAQTDLQTALNAKLTQSAADALYSPLSHVHTFASLTSKPTTIAGFGITDAYTKTETDNAISSAVVGLLDDRGNYNASGNVFPSSGGSGAAGAILKGDLWTISVAGTLGGVAVTSGDVLRSLVDTPGQTNSNWVITENNLGYVPVNTVGTLALNGFSSITGTLPAGNVATLNQNTIGSAASLSISGQTGLLTFTGLAGTNRIKTVRDAADTILELGGSYTPTGTWTNLTLVTPALGTPASGVVTNLTGTASININGTVGATTPTTGAFTTLTNTGAATITLANAQAQTNTITGLGTTTLPGLQVTNTTAAAAGAQQYSPSMRWTGQGWKTTATAASQAVDFRAYVVPVQGAANPTGTWTLESSINGGAFGTVLTSNSAGALGVQFPSNNSGRRAFVFEGDGNLAFKLRRYSDNFAVATSAIFTSDGSITTDTLVINAGSFELEQGKLYFSTDAGIFRDGAGALHINNGTTGQWGGLKLGTYDSGTTTITNALTLGHRSSGTPAAGLGEAILGNLDSSTTADQNAFRLYYKWSDATHATRTSAFGLQLVNSAAALADVLTISGAGLVTIPGTLSVTGQTTLGDVSLFGTSTAPSTASGYALLAIGANQTIQGIEALGASSTLIISQNASYASGPGWKYISTDIASNYYQSGGTHVFRVAPSGTAGAAITWSSPLSIDTNGISINGGATIKKVLTATSTLDFGSTAAGTNSDLTITVTGAALGDVVSLGIPNGSIVAGGVFYAWVSATNTVTVRFENGNLVSASDPASGTFRVTVIQF